ncbi:MAG: hypothetical protein ABIX46_07345 [Burkholderiaceae bacterium]
MTWRRMRAPAAALAAALGACAPSLNWRDVQLADLRALFPCRPDVHQRRVVLAGATAPMQMHVCEAAGLTFAVAFVDLDTPEQVERGLIELRALAVGNIGGSGEQRTAGSVPGMTPNPQAGQVSVQGRLPDASPVRLRAAFFSKGLRVFQATVVGADPGDEATQPFFGGLKLAS